VADARVAASTAAAQAREPAEAGTAASLTTRRAAEAGTAASLTTRRAAEAGTAAPLTTRRARKRKSGAPQGEAEEGAPADPLEPALPAAAARLQRGFAATCVAMAFFEQQQAQPTWRALRAAAPPPGGLTRQQLHWAAEICPGACGAVAPTDPRRSASATPPSPAPSPPLRVCLCRRRGSERVSLAGVDLTHARADQADDGGDGRAQAWWC
jgi:hypothetical protein